MLRSIKWPLIACLIPGGILLLVFSVVSRPPAMHPSGLAVVSTPDGSTIFCEVVDTPETRSRGLMYRTYMALDRGMLFVFPEARRWTFWMKNTRMPLDILWLAQNGTIVDLQEYVPVCEQTGNLCPRYQSKAPAHMVLELRAGQAGKLNLARGVHLAIAMPK